MSILRAQHFTMVNQEEKWSSKSLITFQNAIVLLSLLLYIFSFTQVAFTQSDGGSVKDYVGYEAFLAGAVIVLGGGLPEWFIWLANPLLFLCLWLTAKGKKRAIIAGAIAFLLSFSFNSRDTILASESGRTAAVTSKRIGYYAWTTSMALMTIAAGRNLFYRSRMFKSYVFDKDKE